MNNGQCTLLKSDHAHPFLVQLYDTSLPASSLTKVGTWYLLLYHTKDVWVTFARQEGLNFFVIFILQQYPVQNLDIDL